MVLSKEARASAVKAALKMLAKAHITIAPAEAEAMEVATFGLPEGNFPAIGLEIVVFVNNDRYCAKELVVFPGQICPEHRHPEVDGHPGKQETFRCRWGDVYVHIPGDPTPNPKGHVPAGKEACFTSWHEIILKPGQQYTLQPDIFHWFQGGPKGAVISEFSSTSTDENDIFTDPEAGHAVPT